MGKIIKQSNKTLKKNVVRNVIYMIMIVVIGLLGFSFYTYKTLESHIDYSNCVSYIPYYSDTTLKM